MLYEVYSIYDMKAGLFLKPIFVQKKGQAIRMFENACGDVNAKDSMLSKYPNDFQLHRIGEFDEESGKINGLVAPEFVVNGSDFVKPKGE